MSANGTTTRDTTDKIAVRDARHDEARFIVQMTRHMVADMATYGGHAPATEHEAWETLSVAVAAELHGQNSKYVIAETANGDRIGVAGAELRTLGGAFAPKKTLHISVVYVLPSLRCNGIGGKLLASVLDWGRTVGSEQCDLNVLSRNPARSLYDKHGFSVFEVKMVCSL
jgi:GNAT superfamily N-acetyltransferase